MKKLVVFLSLLTFTIHSGENKNPYPAYLEEPAAENISSSSINKKSSTQWSNPFTRFSNMYEQQRYFAFSPHPTLPIAAYAGYFAYLILKNAPQHKNILYTGVTIGAGLGMCSGLKNMNIRSTKKTPFDCSHVAIGAALGMVGIFTASQIVKNTTELFSTLSESFKPYPL